MTSFFETTVGLPYGWAWFVSTIVGILVILAVVAPLLGLAARRRPIVGVVGFAAFGLVGAAASLDGGTASAAVPAALSALIGAPVLILPAGETITV